MWWLLLLAVVIILFAVYYAKTQSINYSIGSGLFKNSEYNLDDPEELADKDYFDKDGMLK